jgi:protein involved in polysaccharide export with SLBB domain
VDLSIRASFDVRLLDGDSVFVPSILPGIVNMVSLKGKVEHPGDYELKEGMRVSDLFSDDNQPLGEAYMERADIIRLNADGKTTTLIATNLGKALSKDIEHNIRLLPFDKIIVYSKWEIKFLPSRLVTVSGAVQRPGRYERSDGMTVMDLLVVSGGLMPDTDLKRADLLRYDYSSQKYLNIPINLVKAQADIRSDNILLKDSDTFTVYSLKDVEFTPDHKVDIHGAVQRPGIQAF